MAGVKVNHTQRLFIYYMLQHRSVAARIVYNESRLPKPQSSKGSGWVGKGSTGEQVNNAIYGSY